MCWSVGSHTIARVKLLSGICSGAPCPTESHISTLPFGSTAWKIGTTLVDEHRAPGSALAGILGCGS